MPLLRHRLSAGQIVDVASGASTLQRPLPRSLRIVLVGPESSTVAACLGSLFAQRRGDEVILFDLNGPSWTASERLGAPADDSVGESRMRVVASNTSAEDVKNDVYVAPAGLSVVPVAVRYALPQAAEDVTAIGGLFAVHCIDAEKELDLSSLLPLDVLVVCGAASAAGKRVVQRIAAHHANDRFATIAALTGARDQRVITLDAGGRQVQTYLLPHDAHLAKREYLRTEKLSPAFVEALTVLGSGIVERFGSRR